MSDVTVVLRRSILRPELKAISVGGKALYFIPEFIEKAIIELDLAIMRGMALGTPMNPLEVLATEFIIQAAGYRDVQHLMDSIRNNQHKVQG